MDKNLFGRYCSLNKLPREEIQHRVLEVVMGHHLAGDEDWIEQVNYNLAFGWAVFVCWRYRKRLIRHGIEVTRQRLREMLDGKTEQEVKVMPEPKALRVFSFEGKETRVVDVNGEPWWVAKDICEILGIQNVTQAVERLDEDERSMSNIGRQGEANVINESGMYVLILRSDKPEAKKFRKWVTSEVLPAIRKTGSYSAPVPVPVSPHQELRDLIEQNRGVIGKVALGKLVLMLAASIQADATKA